MKSSEKQNKKKQKAVQQNPPQEEEDISHLTEQDYIDELEHKEYSMFWDSMDIENNKSALIKFFFIRFCFILAQVHLKKHPDEIQQGKEIAYKILNGQTEGNIHGVQSFSTWEWWQGYNLRTWLYPLWLSLAGFVLKFFGLDTNILTVNSVYFMHCIIWTIGDYYCYKFVRQLLGKREAIATLMYSLTSEHVNDYVLRTSANGVEGNLMFVVFYYYLNIKPKIFDKNLSLLTLAITFSFAVRSSSIVGYAPLAIIAIIKDFNFFIPILVAGLTIAIPTVLLNLVSDAYFYGYWTVPQYNFVYVNVVLGISKYFGEMPWYYYIDNIYNEFCEIETYGLPIFFLLSVRQFNGTLTPASGNGWIQKIVGETPAHKLIRTPFLLIFFFVTFVMLSSLEHKEMRFITSLVQIGQIAQAYMITWCFDARDIVLITMRNWGYNPYKSNIYKFIKWASGIAIKGFAIFVVIQQEKGRIIRQITNNRYKQDSGQEAYNMFARRSQIYGEEQPESVYFIDKFMQPTHLYLHSNPLDYPETAKKRNQSYSNWDQTIVLYETFRAPMFIPAQLREMYEEGKYEIALPRDQFNGTEEEYLQTLPGQIMDKWVNELQTTQLVRFIDELNTPNAMLPQYLFFQHCENVWRMQVQADSLYKLVVKLYISKYYDKIDDFYFWNRVHAKEQVDYIFKKHVWKLKPEHQHRMIKAGYGQNPDTKSLGKYFDIERSFHGYPGPLTKNYNFLFPERQKQSRNRQQK